ncbi:streptomycin 6-kinase [Kitasatospora sp. MAA4]|uniref:aminoglycoside phosphotransferase family protein n=1 Tax=Kitasatospora sp. MAA4 TaxID=3035093 RepID=UPI0024765815|nr:aminoglycoside phosphotransferase family protein [Kitasatospora sp. MAA4]MDH6132802.1 streptomycin 6-kinase [Kitasatospora sp. MAA4]
MGTVSDLTSTGGRRRLLTHYGSAVEGWLAQAPEAFSTVARRWNLTLSHYHDVGHASLLMVARYNGSGHKVLLKAWPDRERYRNELLALRAWAAGPVAQVVGCADDLAIMAMEVVGAAPGGAARPAGEYEPVAAALQQLHVLGRRQCVPTAGLPSLQDFLDIEMAPRMHRRLREDDPGILRDWIGGVGTLAGSLWHDPKQVSVLHADLYRENVLFDREHRPVLIDPLPLVGDVIFDWAFWTVYYDLGTATLERFETAVRTGGLDPQRLSRWCLVLCVDGFLYYREVGDGRAPVMKQVIDALARAAGPGRPQERKGRL